VTKVYKYLGSQVNRQIIIIIFILKQDYGFHSTKNHSYMTKVYKYLGSQVNRHFFLFWNKTKDFILQKFILTDIFL
jgi:hypothetical protein